MDVRNFVNVCPAAEKADSSTASGRALFGRFFALFLIIFIGSSSYCKRVRPPRSMTEITICSILEVVLRRSCMKVVLHPKRFFLKKKKKKKHIFFFIISPTVSVVWRAVGTD
jgi:polyferredoxin